MLECVASRGRLAVRAPCGSAPFRACHYPHLFGTCFRDSDLQVIVAVNVVLSVDRGSSSGQSMNTTLLAPAQWAQMEFGLAELGDQRRKHRLVNIAQGLAKSPGGTLPQAFPAWKDLKAAYRFFNQAENSYEQILTPHWQRTRAACREAGEYLLIEDTTELDYTNHPATM